MSTEQEYLAQQRSDLKKENALLIDEKRELKSRIAEYEQRLAQSQESVNVLQAQIAGMDATMSGMQETNDALFLTLGHILHVAQKRSLDYQESKREGMSKAYNKPIRIISKHWQEDSMSMMQRKYRESKESKKWGPTE